MNEPVYRAIASRLIAIENCKRTGNDKWECKHSEALDDLMDKAPHGSGIDNGIHLLVEECGREKLVFQCDFHHMDENGYYDGWTEHRVTVRPSLFHGIAIQIGGRDRNQIKDYLYNVLHSWLTMDTNEN